MIQLVPDPIDARFAADVAQQLALWRGASAVAQPPSPEQAALSERLGRRLCFVPAISEYGALVALVASLTYIPPKEG